jgi:hypothetical protein
MSIWIWSWTWCKWSTFLPSVIYSIFYIWPQVFLYYEGIANWTQQGHDGEIQCIYKLIDICIKHFLTSLFYWNLFDPIRRMQLKPWLYLRIRWDSEISYCHFVLYSSSLLILLQTTKKRKTSEPKQVRW